MTTAQPVTANAVTVHAGTLATATVHPADPIVGAMDLFLVPAEDNVDLHKVFPPKVRRQMSTLTCGQSDVYIKFRKGGLLVGGTPLCALNGIEEVYATPNPQILIAYLAQLERVLSTHVAPGVKLALRVKSLSVDATMIRPALHDFGRSELLEATLTKALCTEPGSTDRRTPRASKGRS
jgi:hypothetical protein